MRMSISIRRCLSFFMSLIILVTMFYALGSEDKVSAASADYSLSLTAAKTWTRPFTNGYPQFTGITTGLGNYCYTVMKLQVLQ